jgi:hypothetical protein
MYTVPAELAMPSHCQRVPCWVAVRKLLDGRAPDGPLYVANVCSECMLRSEGLVRW